MAVTKIDIDTRTVVRVMAVAVAFWLGLAAVIKLRGVIAILLISFFLSLALNPPVSYLSRRLPGGGRAIATGLAYVIVLGVLGLFVANTIPPLVRETRNLVQTIPQRIEEIRSSNNNGVVADFIERYQLEDEANELASNITTRLGDVGGPLLSGVGRITSSLVGFITVLVLTFLMLIEGPQWAKLFWSYVPKSRRAHHQALALRMYNVVTGYVNGQLLIASIAGLTSLVAMVAVGIPNAIALAGVITLTGLLPLIGATLGAVIIVLVALFQSLGQALFMLVFFVVYQQIENNAIQPYVQSRALEISPLLVLVAVIVGVTLGGLLGGFLAIPTAACIRILLLDYVSQSSRKPV